jgi:hypothetical protein
VDVNDEAFRAHFPYVALAHSGSETASPGGKTTPSAYHAAPDRRTAPPSYSAELSTNGGSAGVGRADELATVIAVTGLAFGGLGVALLVQARRRRTVTIT